MTVDAAALRRAWHERWPEVMPLGYLFRHHVTDRWVRFHSLPGSKRYAEDEPEYRTILGRQETLLDELGADDVYLITPAFHPPGDPADQWSPVRVGLHPGAVPWWELTDPADPEWAAWTYVSRIRYRPGSLDPLLRYVADDGGYALITPPDLRWVFAPYDGGVDLVLADPAARDALRDRHRDWLSAHPLGW
ncbi:DUF3885 domain-containing protein [Actinocatenispora rupis]|uniref:DUF3885 domain-containing protein n=1 Tax=Actinocatenispora rupis TaxID=519421 RepID=A0A8J3JDJ6_9ACTN|nr:hypothetical protein [Actinocatenispora rupis]GID14754.1 hypothetical protein Aru02nite_56430 [Actinocatenispora rupis]